MDFELININAGTANSGFVNNFYSIIFNPLYLNLFPYLPTLPNTAARFLYKLRPDIGLVGIITA